MRVMGCLFDFYCGKENVKAEHIKCANSCFTLNVYKNDCKYPANYCLAFAVALFINDQSYQYMLVEKT